MYGFNGYPTQYASQPVQDERIWVQGQGGAEAYLVAPNCFVRLWDSTRPVFYEKRADNTGRPSMDVFEYKRCDPTVPAALGANAIGNELTALKSRITALENWRYKDELGQNGNHEPIPEFPENL